MKPSEWLYHVTLAANLESIVEGGLRGGTGRTFSGYGWSSARLFVSERGAVRCWWNKISDIVHHHNEDEDILPRLKVPIVLRTEAFHFKNLVDDPAGSRDCLGARSFYAEGAVIKPRAIEVWNGRSWTGLLDADPERIAMAYVESEKRFASDGYEWTEVELRLPGNWPW